MTLRLLLIFMLLNLFCAVFAISCGQKNGKVTGSEQILVVPILDEEQYVRFEELIDSIHFLPIKNDTLIGHADMLEVVNDSIFFIGDSKYSKSIFWINSDGAILKTHKYLGKGPNEGLYLEDIEYDSDQKEYLALLSSQSKLLKFNSQFQHIETKNLQGGDYYRIHAGSKYFLYDPFKYVVNSYSKSQHKSELLRKFQKTEDKFYPSPVFFTTNNKTYFNVPKSPYVYLFDNGDFSKEIRLEWPKKEVASNASKIEQVINLPPTVTNIYETSDKIFIEFSYRMLMRYAIQSKETKKMISQGIFMDPNSLECNILSSKGRVLYGVMSSDRFIKLLKDRDKNEAIRALAKFPNNCELIDYDSNPIIVKYYLK
ncbi:6-bladed beta-propeller [Puteibacter caeruleilacunae]|nr:6-bladed beta-propeller [Puteibacter caeruleilacunae]